MRQGGPALTKRERDILLSLSTTSRGDLASKHVCLLASQKHAGVLGMGFQKNPMVADNIVNGICLESGSRGLDRSPASRVWSKCRTPGQSRQALVVESEA